MSSLAGPGFARLFEQVRRRLEREPDALDRASTSLRNPSREEREAIGGLLGRRLQGKSISVRFAELDQAMLHGTGKGLWAWLEELGGPLRDRPAEEAAQRAAMEAALQRAAGSPLAPQAWFQSWLDDLRGAALTRMANEDELERLDAAVAILEALPVQNQPIALFASQHAGGTKALDGTPLERLVLRALAVWAGCGLPEGAEARRELWERLGVLPDDLTAQVLVLNLPASGERVTDRILQAGAEAGVPVRLTLHQLVQHPPTLGPVDVYVCENPAVVRVAAEQLGAGCATLICTEGRPSTAFWRLVALVEGTVRARADFDKEGLERPHELEGSSDFHPLESDEAEIRAARRRHRVGQRTFRARLLKSYGGQCAITREHTRPVLAAAHIQPYLGPRSNHLQNGLILTQEFHTLFDRGLVTVEPPARRGDDYRLRVSNLLNELWNNGRRYREYDGRRLVVPERPELRPSREALEWHRDRVFERVELGE